MLASVWDRFSMDEKTWASATFGKSELGDRRLTKRLVAMAAALACRDWGIRSRLLQWGYGGTIGQ